MNESPRGGWSSGESHEHWLVPDSDCPVPVACLANCQSQETEKVTAVQLKEPRKKSCDICNYTVNGGCVHAWHPRAVNAMAAARALLLLLLRREGPVPPKVYDLMQKNSWLAGEQEG